MLRRDAERIEREIDEIRKLYEKNVKKAVKKVESFWK